MKLTNAKIKYGFAFLLFVVSLARCHLEYPKDVGHESRVTVDCIQCHVNGKAKRPWFFHFESEKLKAKFSECSTCHRRSE